MGNRFTVTDVATKRTFMHSKPKYPSFRRRMNVYDGNEKLLFDIIQPPFHMIHPTFSIQGQDKAELMRVRFGGEFQVVAAQITSHFSEFGRLIGKQPSYETQP